MSALRSRFKPARPQTPLERYAVQIEAFGALEPISRLGGQGRVHRPDRVPPEFGQQPLVVKLYRRTPSAAAARVLAEMVAWSWTLEHDERARLHGIATWPLTVVSSGLMPVGIAMRDVSGRFAVPFVMPSGRRERVLLALEHLLGEDSYLQLRGLGIPLDTSMRARVAERVTDALSYLHRHGIVVSDLAPSNLLVAFDRGLPSVCFIDCDSMVFRGEQGLAPVETGDWNIPPDFAEPPRTRSADAYKLGLLMLRLFARSHDTRAVGPHLRYVPAELHRLLGRALCSDVANRPPAGEWQRALRELLAHHDLNQRYPGPAPRPRPAPRPQAEPATVTTAPLTGAAGQPRPSVAGAARSWPSSAQHSAGSPWLRPAVAVLWLLAGAVVFILILSRLFADAIPSQNAQPQYRPAGIYLPQSRGGAPQGGAGVLPGGGVISQGGGSSQGGAASQGGGP